jgi:hypothetical protein
MNTGERIVESYFRHCRGCFTTPDVKVKGGNNRQIDLLAFEPKSGVAYHVESSVLPSGRYFNKSSSWKSPIAIFQNKFFGQPPRNQTPTFVVREDDTNYRKIQSTYALHGIDPVTVRRVWVCWNLGDYGISLSEIYDYFEQRSVQRDLVEIVSFRDVIVPSLQQRIGSSNYEDDVLRTFSFFAARDYQLKIEGNASN